MKTSFKSFLSLCAIFSLTSGLAVAQDNGPAEVVIAADSCTLRTEFGVQEVGDLVGIIASSENGNINFTCTYEGEPTTTGRAIVWNFDITGTKCKVPGGLFTDDWHEVISASGKIKLVCHYKQD